MNDVDVLKLLAPLGVGGLLAAMMFVLYRKDSREDKAAWRGQHEIMMAIVKENTAAITALITLMRDSESRRAGK